MGRTLEMRARRREKGLCIYCGKVPPKNGRVGCEKCLRKRSDEALAIRVFYLSHGICPICRKNKVADSHALCAECLEKTNNQSRINRLNKRMARGS